MNKKILIALSVFFSQLAALTDLALIAIFSFLITGQATQVEVINYFLDFILFNKFLILGFVILRYSMKDSLL